MTFPLGIHLEKIRKQRRSVDTETPTRGKMFGWDKCFHHMISRHNRWFEAEQWTMCKINRRYLENLVWVTPVRLELLDGYGTSRVFSVAYICESTVVVNTSDVYDFVLENMRWVRSSGLCRSWRKAVNPAAGVCHRGMTTKDPPFRVLSCQSAWHIICSHGQGK